MFALDYLIKGSLGGAAVWRLPLAQGAILETRDRVPRRAPAAWSLPPSACVSASLSFSLCVTIINKYKLKKNLDYLIKFHNISLNLVLLLLVFSR